VNFANSHLVTPNRAQIKLYNNPANIVEKKFLPEGVVDYTYDSEYNLTVSSNTDSTLNFTYDPLSRLVQAQTGGTVQPATSISYGYDLNSNLTSMTDPAGIATNYVYDTLNRLTGITDAYGVYISSYTYDALNRRTGKSFAVSGSPLAVNYNYDLASNLLSINYQPSTPTGFGGQATINFGYTYDNVGNRLSLTDTNGLHNYSYDNVYRLVNSTNPSETYSYDPVSNRNPLTNNYDGGNRLLDDDIYTYTYDLDGNMTKKVKKIGGETTTYTYNSEDQLIGVNSNITYKYDALGRRIEKNVGGTITRYIYDGEDIIQELDGSNVVIAKYIHGPSIDEPILVEKSGQKYYYISDGLGSITAIVDQNGNIAQSYRYDSFGNILSTTGSLTQPYSYTGREYDPETGLYYYRARYYDAHSGRFLQEDPVQSINAYSYVYNNPLNLRDPYGLYAGIDDAVFAGGGALIGVAGQGIADLITWNFSGWESYTGAAVGGALAGETLLYTANPVLAGAVAGGASNVTRQRLRMFSGKQCKFDIESLLWDTGVGAALGFIPGPKVPGITSGKGNFNFIFKQMTTKLGSGQIANLRFQTAAKMFVGQAVKSNMLPGTVAGSAMSK
jgi:RHS repeat-associated protein